ncbi:ATP-dependent nuclease, partial [Bacteroides cellulosilyticus]
MHISKIKIHGFRCFNSEGASIEIDRRLNAFIGLNSSGKTAALEALRKLFGITNAERNISKQDFHVACEEGDEVRERSLSIEARLDFDESETDAIPHFFSSMVVDAEGENPYIRVLLESIWTKNDLAEEGDIDTKLYFINVPESEDSTDESKHAFPKHLRGLIQAFYVPAIRRPSEQMRYISGSILYRVLSSMKFSDEFKENYLTKITELNSLFQSIDEFSTIESTLSDIWSEFHKDERYKDVSLSFGTSEIESILQKLEISFSPTEIDRPYQIDELGEGYRSLFYFTLVCTLLKIEEEIDDEERVKPLLTILAIEEPENHIAPQLLGRVIKVLTSISKQDKAQVFLSSHTPAIIKRLDPESIFHFRINEDYATEINKIYLPKGDEDAYKYVKEAVKNYPEIYFARLVVIGEGDSEHLIFNRLMEVYDKDFDDNIISFAPLGHRFVNHIWKLLSSIHVPYITLLDLDVGREGGGWGRVKYALQQLINIGKSKKKLLEVDGGEVLSDEAFEKMHTWGHTDNKLDSLMGRVTFLKKYNIFYSSPLD